MSSSFENCTQVTLSCPVEATTYGYTPSLSGNLTLLVVFGVCLFPNLYFGARYGPRSFATVLSIGILLEILGYAGRLMMNGNPWNDVGFKLQIVCLILAPSFLAAGIYFTLKHLVINLGRANSRIQPKFYTWTFIGCDAISIVIQAIGGGMAASGGSLAAPGGNIMTAGIAFQVATMSLCVVLAIDFALRTFRNRQKNYVLSASNAPKPVSTHFLLCFTLSFATIFVRCVYR